MKPSAERIAWRFVPFGELTTHELYAILRLRSEVFVVEQSCVFQDMDDADQDALHLIGTAGAQLGAYARCILPGVKFAEASIGRVITSSHLRGGGAGHLLVQEAIVSIEKHWGRQPIRIGAQARLENFYRQHGFVDAGIHYIEDGIAHIEMLRSAATKTMTESTP